MEDENAFIFTNMAFTLTPLHITVFSSHTTRQDKVVVPATTLKGKYDESSEEDNKFGNNTFLLAYDSIWSTHPAEIQYKNKININI